MREEQIDKEDYDEKQEDFFISPVFAHSL